MSDVHANPAALEAALKDAHVQGCGRFVMLGDTTGYGYDVKEAIKLVRSEFDIVLMGNHDSACLGREPAWETETNPNYHQDQRQRVNCKSSESIFFIASFRLLAFPI